MVTHVAFRAGQTTRAGWDTAQGSTAAPEALEVFPVSLCSPGGGVGNAKENGKKRASIMTRDKGK